MSSAWSPDELVRLANKLQNAAQLVVASFREAPNEPTNSESGGNLDAQQNISQCIAELQRLTTSPGDFLNRQAIQCQHLACLRWLCHFDIVSHVPIDHYVSYEDVADAAGVPLTHLRSVARMGMTMGFMKEPTPGCIAHSDLSACFARDPSLVDWALFIADGTASSAGKLVEATEMFGGSEAKNQTAYNIAKSSDLPFFEYLSSDKRLAGRFAGYMKNVTNTPATSVEHVVTGFDWGGLGSGTVVDIGGSSGHVSLALAEAFPLLNFVVQDLPTTIETSAPGISSSSQARRRVTFQPHDFFAPQPFKGAEVYFLRTVIHDWDFASACQIISHIARAMEPQKSRLVIMDIILPSVGSVSIAEESLARLRDLTMLETFNTREREECDWGDLIAAVGQELEIVGVRKPKGSSLSVIEVIKGHDRGDSRS